MKSNSQEIIERIIASRAMVSNPHEAHKKTMAAEEGGCGVTGFIASVPVSGRHI